MYNNNRFFCFCGKSFTNQKNINTHQIKYHPNEINQAKARASQNNINEFPLWTFHSSQKKKKMKSIF